jgi:hypothetical protein
MRNDARVQRSGIKRAACTLALATVAPASAATSTARAQQLAAAGTLTTSDLAGWTVLSSGGGGSGTDSGEFACAGVKGAPILAGAEADFGHGASFVLSSAGVAKSASAAKADLKAMKSAHMLSCMKTDLLRSLKSEGISSVSIARVTAKVAGADDSIGFRVTLTGKISGISVALHDYVVQARVGQTEITVMSQKVNSGSPSLTKTIGYAKTLAHRVRAA